MKVIVLCSLFIIHFILFICVLLIVMNLYVLNKYILLSFSTGVHYSELWISNMKYYGI